MKQTFYIYKTSFDWPDVHGKPVPSAYRTNLEPHFPAYIDEEDYEARRRAYCVDINTEELVEFLAGFPGAVGVIYMPHNEDYAWWVPECLRFPLLEIYDTIRGW